MLFGQKNDQQTEQPDAEDVEVRSRRAQIARRFKRRETGRVSG